MIEQPLGWALLGFGVFFTYAQYILHVSWNAIELIIAQNLLSHGAFATSLDYPSAVTWRPVVPTFVVTALRLTTDDPLTIYRVFCGVAVATLASCLFLTAKRLAGVFAAHVAAALTLICPAITTYLVDHAHSYSHWGAMLTLGPAILVTTRLLLPEPHEPRSWRRYALGGACWGLAYLSRSEMLLFAGLAFVALVVVHLRERLAWRLLVAWVAPFAVLFAAYNFHAGAAAARDGILIRKSVYTFYISQGWVDPAPWTGPDIEGDGYRYARQLYGEPKDNDENLLKTISRNPKAFARRVWLNLGGFYRSYFRPGFFSGWWTVAAGLMLVALATRFVPVDRRLPLLFLGSLFAASHFILILHIDHRYLTINVPALLILAACFAGWLVDRATKAGPLAARGVQLVLVLVVAWTALPQLRTLRHHRPRDDRSIQAMRALGEHFRAHVPEQKRTRNGNRQPHILFQFPDENPLRPEDQFLVAYFTRTSWVNGGAEGEFPRGRFYSYRDCPHDYLYLPASKLDHFPGAKNRVISQHDNPVLGTYYLVAAR